MTSGDLVEALRVRSQLLDVGVQFPGRPPGEVPWLQAIRPFALDNRLLRSIKRLGDAVFAFVDAVQMLYIEGNERVRAHLDLGVPRDLRGLDLMSRIETFRLDLIISGGVPLITEIEEVYGNAGKAYAMQLAYGVSYLDLFQAFADIGVTHVLVDDGVTTYDSELRLFATAIKSLHSHQIEIAPLSTADLTGVGTAWRFCYTTDLAQYPVRRRSAIIHSGIRFVNPLFHGYGTKALLALAWDSAVQSDLERAFGRRELHQLRRNVPRCWVQRFSRLSAHNLLKDRANLVAKVISSPADRSATWGSRGTYFGESSNAKWQALVDAITNEHLPARPEHPAAYMLMDLVESDRFDVEFLHPDLNRIALMRNARIRLAPIFFRRPQGPQLVAGHATFVATSRKVHLGSHAVCAPLNIVGAREL